MLKLEINLQETEPVKYGSIEDLRQAGLFNTLLIDAKGKLVLMLDGYRSKMTMIGFNHSHAPNIEHLRCLNCSTGDINDSGQVFWPVHKAPKGYTFTISS